MKGTTAVSLFVVVVVIIIIVVVEASAEKSKFYVRLNLVDKLLILHIGSIYVKYISF